MAKEAFIGQLPLFGQDSPLTAALDDPTIAAYGAVIAKAGSEYRLHRLEELSTAHVELGQTVTFAELKGHRLRTATATEAKEAGLVLETPHKKSVDAASRAFQESLGFVPGFESATGRAVALIVAHAAGNFVLVGNRYVCSKYGEPYDEDDYVDNHGKCPLHKGATLVRQP